MHNQSKKQATRSSRQRRQSNSSSSGSVPEMRVPSLPSSSASTSMRADSFYPAFSYPPPLPSGTLSNPPSMPNATPPLLSYPPPLPSPSSSRHLSSPSSYRTPDPAAQLSYPPPGPPASGYGAPNAESGSIAPSVPWFPPGENYNQASSNNFYLPPTASSSANFASSSTAQAYRPQLRPQDDDYREEPWSSSDDEDDEDDDAWYASHYAVDPSRLSEPSGSAFDARGSEPPSSSPASTSRLSRSRTPLVIETIPSREQLTEEREMRRRQSRSAKMHACRICGKAFPRRSGLETHMNTHSGVRPYGCPFPGCEKLFNVLSNARRHHNTHFYQPPPPRPPEPMEFRFAEPIVEGAPAPPPDAESQAAFNVRWMEHNVAARGQSTGRRKKKSTAAEHAGTEWSSKHSRGPHPRDPEDRARPG
ncbi:hypothetical protein R3P38DRAFT_2960209 [Favolaschia claudopus]|uniref:C2H2-type domain-containing protein n=1 Tax=Favolaschia claudopus TaxID=2862362 RepID=A0AAW0B7Y0_9AGAR